MEGKLIAVWVHSNLDKVELFLNGQSLGMKEMKKDSHLAWNVAYAPGAIEARGYKGDKLVLTAKRETTGAPAALAMCADRSEISADGEDVAMFAVEVRDAQGRVVPDHRQRSHIQRHRRGKTRSASATAIPPIRNPTRAHRAKLSAACAWRLCNPRKLPAASRSKPPRPGSPLLSATIAATQVTLRPQIAAWEREVPEGAGATGLWRPTQEGGTQVFIFSQDGNKLTGSVEGIGAGWAGGYDAPAPITDGKVDGTHISFKVGRDTFSGKLTGETITLERTMNLAPRPGRTEAQPEGPKPAIGPPPDGSDPSRSPLFRFPTSMQIVLHRAKR